MLQRSDKYDFFCRLELGPDCACVGDSVSHDDDVHCTCTVKNTGTPALDMKRTVHDREFKFQQSSSSVKIEICSVPNSEKKKTAAVILGF